MSYIEDECEDRELREKQERRSRNSSYRESARITRKVERRHRSKAGTYGTTGRRLVRHKGEDWLRVG